MATERRAHALLRALAEENVPAEDAATAERRRRRVVEATSLAIARAANDRAKRRRWARAGAAFASAAAIVAVTGAVWRYRAAFRPSADTSGADNSARAVAVGAPLVGTLHRSHQGEPLPAVTGHLPLGAGDEVTTEPGGRGEVVLADGVAITLESETRLRLLDSPADSAAKGRETVALASGTVSVRVPPMSPGHTFSIRTPDAEVTVHGTAFTVEVGRRSASGAPAAPMRAEPATRVRVTAGVVSVSSGGREALLTAGMEWASPMVPVSAEPHAPAPPALAGATSSAAAKMAATPSGHARHDATTAAPSKSRLGEENQLLSSAIAESKGGDYARAVATLDDLLRRFPGSTLAQEAHVERFRALAHGDPSGAAREARLYLALYPDGFAREEAKGLAVGW